MAAVAKSKLSTEKLYDFFLSPTVGWWQGQNLGFCVRALSQLIE